jgi:hypothetical protein
MFQTPSVVLQPTVKIIVVRVTVPHSNLDRHQFVVDACFLPCDDFAARSLGVLKYGMAMHGMVDMVLCISIWLENLMEALKRRCIGLLALTDLVVGWLSVIGKQNDLISSSR